MFQYSIHLILRSPAGNVDIIIQKQGSVMESVHRNTEEKSPLLTMFQGVESAP